MTVTSSRIHVISEGVLASYIHDISSRTVRQEVPVEPQARPTSSQALLSLTAK